eukprot:gene6760-7520_t
MEKLMNAIRNNDYNEVERLLVHDEHLDLRVSNEAGFTCLHYFNTEKITQLLLCRLKQKGLSLINCQNKYGDTPLHMWCKVTSEGCGLLDFCEMKGIMTALLKAGADCNIQNNQGDTVLHTTFIYGGDAGLGLDADQIGDLIELLCMNNADPNIADYDEGATALHYAVTNTSTKNVELLLSKGNCCDVNARDSAGRTALHYLTTCDDETVVKLLLERGADAQLANFDGQTALHGAAACGNEMLARVILEREIYREKSRHPDALSKPANPKVVNMADKNGVTPLHLAAAFKNTSLVGVLVECGADLNAVDRYGDASLHYAAYGGTIEIVNILKNAGADLKLENNKGWVPWDFALQRNYYNTAAALEHVLWSKRLAENSLALQQEFPGDDIFNIWVPENCIMSDPCDLGHITEETWKGLALKFNGDFQSYLEGMMSVQGIGMVQANADINEGQEIQHAIETFMNRLALCVARIDKRFAGEIFKSGSWYEGTKIGEPDEFDFMFCLSEFEKRCLIPFDNETYDDVSVYRKTIASSKTDSDSDLDDVNADCVFDMFFQDNQLQGERVMEALVDACKKALCTMQNDTGSPNLSLIGVTDHTLEDGLWLKTGTTTCELKFIWTGAMYKQLVITTDFVPALHVRSWPSFANSQSNLLPAGVTNKGCHVVHKSEKWRLSFSLVEQAIMTTLPQSIRLAYIGAKVALHPAVAARFSIACADNEAQSSVSAMDEDNGDEQYMLLADDFGCVVECDDDDCNDKDYGDNDLCKEDTDLLDNKNNQNHSKQKTDPVQPRHEISTDSENKSDKRECTNVSPDETPDSTKEHCAETAGSSQHDAEQPWTAGSIRKNTDGSLEERLPNNPAPCSKIIAKKLLTARSESGDVVTALKIQGSDDNKQQIEDFLAKLGATTPMTVNARIQNERTSEKLIPIDARHYIPSYLLKLLLFDCIEDCCRNGTDWSEINACIPTALPNVTYEITKLLTFINQSTGSVLQSTRSRIKQMDTVFKQSRRRLAIHNRRSQEYRHSMRSDIQSLDKLQQNANSGTCQKACNNGRTEDHSVRKTEDKLSPSNVKCQPLLTNVGVCHGGMHNSNWTTFVWVHQVGSQMHWSTTAILSGLQNGCDVQAKHRTCNLIMQVSSAKDAKTVHLFEDSRKKEQVAKEFLQKAIFNVGSMVNKLTIVNNKLSVGIKIAHTIIDKSIAEAVKIDKVCMEGSIEEVVSTKAGFSITGAIAKEKINMKVYQSIDSDLWKNLAVAISEQIFTNASGFKQNLDSIRWLIRDIDKDKMTMMRELKEDIVKHDISEATKKDEVINADDDAEFKKYAYMELPRYTLGNDAVVRFFSKMSPWKMILNNDPLENAFVVSKSKKMADKEREKAAKEDKETKEKENDDDDDEDEENMVKKSHCPKVIDGMNAYREMIKVASGIAENFFEERISFLKTKNRHLAALRDIEDQIKSDCYLENCTNGELNDALKYSEKAKAGVVDWVKEVKHQIGKHDKASLRILSENIASIIAKEKKTNLKQYLQSLNDNLMNFYKRNNVGQTRRKKIVAHLEQADLDIKDLLLNSRDKRITETAKLIFTMKDQMKDLAQSIIRDCEDNNHEEATNDISHLDRPKLRP